MIIGTALALAALEVGMRVAGFIVHAAQNRDNARRRQQQHQFRVLCLGESTTAGSAKVPRYPDLLQNILNRQDLGVSFIAINMGRSGAVTRDLVAQLESELEAFDPNVVVSMMGINDGGKTHAYGTIIEPGRDHWYGTFRLYKLYRLIRHELSESPGPLAEGPSPVFVEGLSHPTPGIARQYVRPGPTPPAPTPQPHDEAKFLSRVRRLIDDENLVTARRLLEDRLSRNPQFSDGYVELARLHTQRGDPRAAHAVLLRGSEELSSPSIHLQSELAITYDAMGDTDRAIEIVVAIRRELLQPSNLVDHTHQAGALAELYEKSGQLESAEACLKEIAETINPGHSRYFDELIAFYERHGRPADAQIYRDLRRRVRFEYVNPETRRNYLRLAEMLRSRGLQLVAVQYPGRNLDETRRLLDGDPSVLYVDNACFRNLAEKNGFDTYYTDRFAGDFGHLTAVGNYHVAENVAREIVEHFFGRDLVDVPLADLVGGGVPE